MDAGHTFVERLVREAPALKSVYDRHMLENMGELLPHVFMGELTGFVIDERGEELRSGAPRPVLDLVLRELEAGLTGGDPDIAELVVASFLENLWQAEGAYQDLVGRLGPQLRKALKLVESGR